MESRFLTQSHYIVAQRRFSEEPPNYQDGSMDDLPLVLDGARDTVYASETFMRSINIFGYPSKFHEWLDFIELEQSTSTRLDTPTSSRLDWPTPTYKTILSHIQKMEIRNTAWDSKLARNVENSAMKEGDAMGREAWGSALRRLKGLKEVKFIYYLNDKRLKTAGKEGNLKMVEEGVTKWCEFYKDSWGGIPPKVTCVPLEGFPVWNIKPAKYIS